MITIHNKEIQKHLKEKELSPEETLV